MYYVCGYWSYRLFWRCSNTSQLKLVACFIVTRLHQVKVNRTTVLWKSYANFCSTKGSNTLPFTKHNSINLPKHKSIHPNKNQFTKTQLNFSKQKQFSQIWFIFPETQTNFAQHKHKSNDWVPAPWISERVWIFHS